MKKLLSAFTTMVAVKTDSRQVVRVAIKRLMTVIVGMVILIACQNDNDISENVYADLVVYGKIFTADKAESVAKAFAVKDDKFIYVGSKDEVEKYITDKTKVVNYNGKGLVIPGCTEGHGHFIGVAGITSLLPGYKASYKDLVKSIIRSKEIASPGPFISFGWATQDVDKFSKTDYALQVDSVSMGHPAILIDGSGHSAICNRVALAKAGLINDKGEKIKDIRGGDIITKLDDTGTPTNIASGYITDEVIPYVIKRAVKTILDDNQYHQAVLNAVKSLNKRGYTCYVDAAMNYLDDDAKAYQYASELDQLGKLTINMIGYYNIRSYDWGLPKGGNMPKTVTEKINYISTLARQYSQRHIIANGLKLFADGVVETATGWISQKYLDKDMPEDKKHGNIIWQQEELNQIVVAANAKGLPVHTHTFGDMACKAVINAYSASPSAKYLSVRNSLAHVRNIQKADILRCATNDIAIASNLIWHVGSPDFVCEFFYSLMPKDVYDKGYPMKSLMDAGIIVSSSTDAPAAEDVVGTVPNVIGVSVTGLSPQYPNVQSLNPSELLTVKQVLKCLTINGAASLGMDNERGSIEVGKYADFVFLDQDVIELEKQDKCQDIFKTNVHSTWFEGRQVYPIASESNSDGWQDMKKSGKRENTSK